MLHASGSCVLAGNIEFCLKTGHYALRDCGFLVKLFEQSTLRFKKECTNTREREKEKEKALLKVLPFCNSTLKGERATIIMVMFFVKKSLLFIYVSLFTLYSVQEFIRSYLHGSSSHGNGYACSFRRYKHFFLLLTI